MKKRGVSKRKINIKLAIQLLIITTAISSILSVSKFKTVIDGKSNAVIAVPILESARIDLTQKIYPGMAPIKYDLKIENQKDNKINEVTLNYDIQIEKNIKIPLKIEIYEKGKNTNLLNANGITPSRKMSYIQSKHEYELAIIWDKDDNNYSYSDEIGYIKIDINAVQAD